MNANLSNGNLANSTLLGADLVNATGQTDLLNVNLEFISRYRSPLNIPLGFKMIMGLF